MILYHATNYQAARNILRHDYFRVTEGATEVLGLSTTTDPNYWWGGREIRFVLEGNELSSRYELQGVDESLPLHGGGTLSESEVVVVSDKPITDASEYILRLEYYSDTGKWYQSFIDEAESYSHRFDIDLIKLGRAVVAEKELKPWSDRYVNLTNRQLHRLLSDVELGIEPEGSALERAMDLKLVNINDKGEMSLSSEGKKLLDKLNPPFLRRHGYIYKRAQLSDNALLDKLYEDEYYAYEMGLSENVSPAEIERAKKNIEKLRQEASKRGLNFNVTDTIWETGPPDFWKEYNPKASVRKLAQEGLKLLKQYRDLSSAIDKAQEEENWEEWDQLVAKLKQLSKDLRRADVLRLGEFSAETYMLADNLLCLHEACVEKLA